MRNKSLAAVLALLFSLLGLHRFYLGQWFRGALYILSVPIITVIIAQIIGFPLEESQNEFSIGLLNRLLFAPWPAYLPILAIGIFDFIWFLAISKEKFDARYNQPGTFGAKAFGVNALALLLSVALAYVVFQQFYVEKKVDVVGSDVDFKLTARELSAAFIESEPEAFKKYGEKVVLITGTVIDDETDLSGGDSARDLLLEGEGIVPVKCKFHRDAQDEASKVELGSTITVKGLVRGSLVGEVVMVDCLLQD